MSDSFRDYAVSYPDAQIVVPSDTADLPQGVCRALFLGGAGNIKVTTQWGTTLTITGLAVNTVLPLRIKRIFATGGTTATLMVALY